MSALWRSRNALGRGLKLCFPPREMKKKKQQTDPDDVDPSKVKEEEQEAHPPPPAGTDKNAATQQAVKRGQKVGRARLSS